MSNKSVYHKLEALIAIFAGCLSRNRAALVHVEDQGAPAPPEPSRHHQLPPPQVEQNPTIELGGHQKNVSQHVQPKEQLVKPNGHAGPETGSKSLMVK